MYSEDCIQLTDPFGNTSQQAAPVWLSSISPNGQLGYLSTGSICPAYVGIGTYAPTQHLDVRGSGYFSQNIGLGAQPNSAAQVLAFTNKEVGFCIDHNYNNSFGYAFKAILNNDQTKGIGLYSNIHNKDMFTVYGSGKMVIQNASGPTLQLEENGLLRARQIKIDVNTWPDFVFEEDYKLNSPEEIKSFIIENGHLPDIPSAMEIERDGMDVEEMNKLLLQKVEELTLLLIEQNERIVELENKVNN